MKQSAVNLKLVRIGPSVAILLPDRVARDCSLKAGSFVRVIMFDDELRVRPASAVRAYDAESAEEYLMRRERESDEELIRQHRWD